MTALAARAMTTSDAAGMEKRVLSLRFMVRAWRIERFIWVAMHTVMKMVEVHNGMILTRVLRSSTCCTVQSLHFFPTEPSPLASPSVTNAALFKKLPSNRGMNI